jgi:hypothetical protein
VLAHDEEVPRLKGTRELRLGKQWKRASPIRALSLL